MLKLDRQNATIKTFAVLLSKIVSATISLLFVPVYIRLLGVESYGLVTFYLLLVSALILIDFALSTALSRQVVILRAQNEPEKAVKDLIFSMEIIYGIISIAIALIMFFFAKKIALHWLKAEELPVTRLTSVIQYIGILIALQLPGSIYNGVMTSLDKQILNSVITIIANVLKAAGVILVLKIFSPLIENYFIWQIIITLCSLLVLRYFTWKEISLSSNEKPGFSKKQLKPIRVFAIGMFGVTIVNFLLSMVDKLIVSKIVLLNLVACYSLAFQIASVMGQVITPLQSTIFPKFTELLIKEKFEECAKLYHKACRWVALVIWPLGLMIVFFSEEILKAWAKNDFITTNTAPVLKIVAIGTICNCLMFVPYIFMLSYGKTKFTIIQNIIGSVIFLPMLFWSIPKYGILGASFLWLAINSSYVLISLPLFHKLYMKNELLNWYIKDNFAPLVLSLFLISIAKFSRIKIEIFDSNLNFILLLSVLGMVYVYLMPELRRLALKTVRLKF
jgi:O-antigen/teichoic acid export membrane protein